MEKKTPSCVDCEVVWNHLLISDLCHLASQSWHF